MLIAEGREPMATGQRKDGGKWSRRYVALILENRAVLGEFAPGTKNRETNDKRVLTGKVIPHYFAPVSPRIFDLWTSAEAVKTDRKVIDTRNRRGDFTSLFAGLCRCVSCGSSMTIVHRAHSSTWPTYVARRGTTRILAPTADRIRIQPWKQRFLTTGSPLFEVGRNVFMWAAAGRVCQRAGRPWP
jgi:hypothetical protein